MFAKFTSIDLTETRNRSPMNYLRAQGTFAISNHVAAKHGQVTTVGAGWFTESFGQPGSGVPVDGQTERSVAQ